jgi:exopolyphosphatase/guanosine-5'-triphosphate,3'-diphosphate pyrophosphatase
MRVAYLVSAAMPGVLPKAPLRVDGKRLVLRLEGELAALAGERLFNRLRQLGRLIGYDAVMATQ